MRKGAFVNRDQVLQQAQAKAPGKLLYLASHGSRLFGTHHAGSDYDVRGVYLPPLSTALLGRVKDTVSFESETVEGVLWSFQQWIQMLTGGDTNAIDVYFAATHPEGALLETLEIEQFRTRYPIQTLLPRSLNGMRGFARGQAIKYGAKGNHYQIAKTVLEAAQRYRAQVEDAKVQGFWDEYGATPEAKQLLHSFPQRLGLTQAPDGFPALMVLDKLFYLGSPLKPMVEALQGVVDRYGARALAATDGADWKALAHSLRVLDEVIELHSTGQLQFPLANAGLYSQVRHGQLEYAAVMEHFEAREQQASLAEMQSVLPQNPDISWTERAVIEVYGLA